MSVDFRENMLPYKEIGNFRMWCQKTLPMVYDDSLSYYEVLCKVTKYLNDVIDNSEVMETNIGNLALAYDELQNFVNDYFDNLDVQEEINNKLDRMAQDGTLTQLIGVYVNPIVEGQNTRITVLEGRMDTFARLTEGSTTGDAELQDIRVGASGFGTYPTAGDAVRGQVSALKEDLNEVDFRLSESIADTSRNLNYEKNRSQEVDSEHDKRITLLENGGFQLSEPFLAEEINDWLDKHPEATTTVQDGSLTENKFTNETILKTIKDYVTPQMFGAMGDGIHDDTDAIQNAIANAGVSKKVVYFPRGSYLITRTIVLPYNDMTIYGDFKSEHETRIITSNDVDILRVSGDGCRIQGLVFWNDKNYLTSFNNCRGIVFDRSTIGDGDYSDIDSEVRDCGFANLYEGIHGKGKNLFIYDSLFTGCKYSIVGEHYTFNNNTEYADFRGWRIRGNRFHVNGEAYSKNTEDMPKDLLSFDSWCILFPFQTENGSFFHNEIRDNNADLGYCGFYKGGLSGSVISNNICVELFSAFIYCPSISFSDNKSSLLGCQITGNKITGKSSKWDAWDDARGNIINISNENYVSISNNMLKRCAKTAIMLTGCSQFMTNGNFVHDFMFNYSNKPSMIDTDAGIVLSRSNGTVANNTFDSMFNANIVCVKADSDSSVALKSNIDFKKSTKMYDILATSIISSVDALPWVVPTMKNGFTYDSSRSKGFRKLCDGRVEIDVCLGGGSDNQVAFTLPEGYRPNYTVTLPSVSVWGGDTETHCQFRSDGDVRLNFIGNTAPAQCIIKCVF